MATAAAQTRYNRTITIDFHDETTYAHLLNDGKAFLDYGLAFILSIGLQLIHKDPCRGGGLSHPPLALRPGPAEWHHHLAHRGVARDVLC